MTIERPMFPPRRDNPFRLVGGVDVAQERTIPAAHHYDDPPAKIAWRTRDDVRTAIREHEEARARYGRAAAWTAAAEEDGLPAANIEQARQDPAQLYAEMQESARSLVIAMPTDPKGLVDLLMYLERHFSILPQEVNGRSLAFFMLRTVRLSLRGIGNYGKVGSDVR
jgi:hypothetical protein